ncbi:MAG: excinuclease ABC subunit UvrA [Pirellulaceae bacterium]|nr:excinuclease ABC subunit UvrA [Pirellulaceae bacterium]
MSNSDIVIKGAREHNLRDVNLVLPRNQLICLTGVSGSGKSSLAFDTLFAEGQRRYVESLSSFARHFLQQMPKPDVDLISGLSPSISISQKSSGSNPRSTVGTITEIYDFLRVLYARVGQPYCPKCGDPIASQTREQIISQLMLKPSETMVQIMAPVARAQKGEHRDLFRDLLKQGFIRVRVNGQVRSLNEEISLDRQQRHTIEVVIDRLAVKPENRSRIAEAVELAMKIGEGTMLVTTIDEQAEEAFVDDEGEAQGVKTSANRDELFSLEYGCGRCNLGFRPPSPQMFSFNSPQGMCMECTGLGQYFSFVPKLLISRPELSIKQGCVELYGPWKDFGRWRRHIFQGVADTIERLDELPEGFLLDSRWQDLPEKYQQLWLYGAGDTHITFTWRGGASPMKYGGQYQGIVAELNDKYRNLKLESKKSFYEQYMDHVQCATCGGQRLNEQARHFRLRSKHSDFSEAPELNLPGLCQLSIDQAVEFLSQLELDPIRSMIALQPLKEVTQRLGFLLNVGLEYLTLDRSAPTLSGGETQRIRLAGQIGAGLVGVTYILDEPSIGLHARDNDRLIGTLQSLRNLGNTVVVVEHDEDTMRAADTIIDFGPGPGVHGGTVVAQGGLEDVTSNSNSLTGQYLAGTQRIEIPKQRRAVQPDKMLRVLGARHNNLKNVDVEIPLGKFVCFTGVSGSGKSSIVNDILSEVLNIELNRGTGEPGTHDRIEGIEHLDKMIAIDQSPIGRTPRSNPGTYVKLFDEIRKLYAQMPEAKRRGYEPGRFSFNVKGGRCEACEGNGANKLEMDFLADIWVTCPVCEGQRFNRETLQVKFKDKTISDVLDMDIETALEFFENVPKIKDRLFTLQRVGLDYLTIGQPSPTLSGGEAQRIKLARELAKVSTGRTLYLLDEPTTGLHFKDVKLLLDVLHDFVEAGNTVLVVEHHLDVIKTADWLIDMGPEGGRGGGEVVCAGTPEQVAADPRSYTGQALQRVLKPKTPIKPAKPKGKSKTAKPTIRQATEIVVQGAQQHNLRNVDVTIPRDQMSVFCGPSGSGKSSLAMDTIYAEGQRRYVESLSSYARQFVNQMQKPRVDHVDGLSPAIAIEQKNFGSTPRSTVGTITEIYDYLRILFARLGTPYCPECDAKVGTQTADQVVDKILKRYDNCRVLITAPVSLEGWQDLEELWADLRQKGFVRVRVDRQVYELDAAPTILRQSKVDLQVVVDRVDIKGANRSRIAESVESALSIGRGELFVAVADEAASQVDWVTDRHSQHLACESCGRGFEMLSPHHFSFNSQLGWCPDCEGIGTQMGANPALFLKNMETSLADGALRLWPGLEDPTSQAMLEAVCRTMGIDMQTPVSQLESRKRRILFYGTGERWFQIQGTDQQPGFEFQFKGLYPTLDEASRLSTSIRLRMQAMVSEVECGACGGSRLREDAAAVRFMGLTLDGICRLPLGTLRQTVADWKLDARQLKIAGELLNEIKNRVEFLNDVGLDYLTIGRGSATLSNGESQRIRLASQLGSGLCGVLYVLDEPTIGLHPRDNTRLLGALKKLRDLGNTLVVVEHDREVIENADAIFDFGPEAGVGGGQVVASGTMSQVKKQASSVTGPYLSGKKAIPIPLRRRPGLEPPEPVEAKPAKGRSKKKTSASDANTAATFSPPNSVKIIGARQNNLKNIDVEIPLQTLTVVTGPSGCGKSSLVNEVLYNTLARRLHMAGTTPGAHRKITGIEHINKIIQVDQHPLGNSPSSNPATYTGAFDLIRQLFAELPDAKVRGFSPRRFSFNVAGGRCEACQGNGQNRIEMHFLPDVWVECPVCQGRRYDEETLSVKFQGHTINDVLEMSCGEAVKLFENIPKIQRTIKTLCDVGLNYVKLGQSAPTLSGGEAQRVKLAAELARPDTGRTMYVLDEPTTGLHFDDLAKLLEVLQRLVDLGNSVVLIEHNLDIIKAADWVIELGPEAGHLGGEVVAVGTPEKIVAYAAKATKSKLPRCWTGEAMAPVLAAGPYVERKPFDPHAETKAGIDISDVGAEAKMPWEADGPGWHTGPHVAHNGKTTKWDGKILADIVERIQSFDGWAETNWNERSVVEIKATKGADDWFFHALTGDQWMLKLKFRVRRGTFKADDLQRRLKLKTNNELVDLPIYGNQPRIKVSLQGRQQEVELRLHQYDEIDTPAFRSFVDEAVIGHLGKSLSGAGSSSGSQESQTARDASNVMPWSVLGRKWHLMPKGFPEQQTPAWSFRTLESLESAITAVVGEQVQFDWTQEKEVNCLVESEMISEENQRLTWARIETKNPEAIWIEFAVSQEQLSDLDWAQVGASCEWAEDQIKKRQVIRVSLTSVTHVQAPKFGRFLRRLWELAQQHESGKA